MNDTGFSGLSKITIKQYLNFDRLVKELTQIFKDVRNEMASEDGCEFILDACDDDWIDEYAFEMAVQLNDNMKRYLNNPDHKIYGNFNNIDYDYPQHTKGDFYYDKPLVQAMIDRLNAGDMSKQAEEDRDWLVDWFWNTFGSYGIKYNFQSFLSDVIYCESENQ